MNRIGLIVCAAALLAQSLLARDEPFITNALFESQSEALTFVASHPSTALLIKTQEYRARFIVFYTLPPTTTPDPPSSPVAFHAVPDVGNALFLYYPIPTETKGVVSIGALWVVWYIVPPGVHW